MSSAYIPLMSMYQYTLGTDEDIFKNMILPAGIEKDLLIDTILLRCGQFEVLYSDADFMQTAINVWSRKYYFNFEKWYKALQIQYDPLNNYDRYEEYTDTRSGTSSGQYKENGTSDSKGETEQLRSAYDSSTYQAYQKEIMSGNTIDANSGSDSRKNDEKIDHKAHLYGNIGVTTSQQMLESELDIAKWNLYENIAELFMLEFTLPIY